MSSDSYEIQSLLYEYAFHLDSGDLEEMANMFAHAKFVAGDGSGVEISGVKNILKLYKEHTRIYPDDGTPHTQHVTTNAIVKVEPDGVRAECKSYAIVFQSADDFPIQPIIGVQYFDKFEKANGVWRFSERKIVSRLFGDLSKHLLKSI